jgi:hypothetical protein
LGKMPYLEKKWQGIQDLSANFAGAKA